MPGARLGKPSIYGVRLGEPLVAVAGQGGNLAREFEHQEFRQQLVGALSGRFDEVVKAARIMAESGEQGVFINGRSCFHRGFRISKVTELFQNIVCGFDQLGALLDKFVTAASDGRMNGTGNGENLSPLLASEARSDQRTAFGCCLDNQHATRKAGNDPVASREVGGNRRRTKWKFRNHRTVFDKGQRKFLVAGGVDAVGTGADDGNDRMRREFNVDATVGAPQVAYRECIKKSVEQEGKFVKQSGGRGQFGHVWLKIEPNEAGKGYEFVDAIKGGVVPREFIPAVDKGLRDAVTSGVLAGFPVVDVKFTLFDGSYHDVDSNENAFRMAASMAFKEGMKKASPTLLEPMMAVEVETPEEYMGNVMGDLSSRRGIVHGMEDQIGGIKVIKAEVPLSEMFGYSTSVRSLSQGRATYSMEFKHYTEAPKNVAEAVINKK